MRELSRALGPAKRRVLEEGEIDEVDNAGYQWCLRLLTIARYNPEEDEFEARHTTRQNMIPKTRTIVGSPAQFGAVSGFFTSGHCEPGRGLLASSAVHYLT